MDDLLTAVEVAAALRLPLSTTYLLIQRGELRAIRTGRHLRVPRKSLEDFISSNDEETDPRDAA